MRLSYLKSHMILYDMTCMSQSHSATVSKSIWNLTKLLPEPKQYIWLEERGNKGKSATGHTLVPRVVKTSQPVKDADMMQVYSPFSWFDHLLYRIYLEPWLKRGISRTPAHWPLRLLENRWATLLSKLGWCILSSSLRITIEAKGLALQLGCYNKSPP